MITTHIYNASHSIGKSIAKIKTYLRCHYLRFYVIGYQFVNYAQFHWIFAAVDRITAAKPCPVFMVCS
jgi:hypothetical protein